jgi:hypothetical protein
MLRDAHAVLEKVAAQDAAQLARHAQPAHA